ncbi:MAG: diguanylate cyclase, partial [Spirochaetaceae bacterium]|nr:diguanylate cyclase [Spirochaetaceae bacterium]
MLNIIQESVLGAALAATLYFALYILYRCQSSKKTYLLLTLISASVLILGHLLELQSEDTGEAFTAVKILYVGVAFVSTFTLFFAADFCEIKLHPYAVKLPMVVIALLIIASLWTTRIHHLSYESFWLHTGTRRYFEFVPGPLYPVYTLYENICVLVSAGMIVARIRTWKRLRRQLVMLLLIVLFPMVGGFLYYVMVVMFNNKFHFYFVAYAMSLSNVFLFFGIIRYDMLDITPRGASKALDSIKEAYILIDSGMYYLDSNSSAHHLFPGLDRFRKMAPISQLESWPEELKGFSSETENHNIQFSIVSGQNTSYYSAGINAILSPKGGKTGWTILIRNITDTVTVMKSLEEAAYTDPLTGLYNRRYFMELAVKRFDQAKRLNQRCFVMMFDLDFFKKINDTCGHPAGDFVLQTISARIRDTLRSYDILARYGGEEFILFLTDIDPDHAFTLAERIRLVIGKSPCSFEGRTIAVTASIGLAESGGAETLAQLLKNADKALYQAKAEGRD